MTAGASLIAGNSTAGRGRRRLVRARVAEGDERRRLWDLMNTQYEGFEDYEKRTNRDINVFVLEPR